MSGENKKTISFGFSKLQKVSIIGSKVPPKSDDAVQFIDCLENKSIKVKNEEPKKSVLVIPLNRPDSHSIVQSRIVGRQVKSSETNNEVSASENPRSEEPVQNTLETKAKDVSHNVLENSTENLDQLAAREILEDLKKLKEKKEEGSTFSVPMSSAPVSEKESTLDDYDNIPIAQFGMAMLRGMGWKPGKGIGKNEKLVSAKPPVLRPKGLGLGADKVIQPEKSTDTKEEVLKLVKGSYIRIIAGSHKDLFGEIMGFDEETGRLIAKMSISGSVLTFNEFMVKAVSREEYNKNSKVLNVKKYEDFKEKENAGENPNDIIESMKNQQASKSNANATSSKYKSDFKERLKLSSSDRKPRYEDKRKRYNDEIEEYRSHGVRSRSSSYSGDEAVSINLVKERKHGRSRSSSESGSARRRQKHKTQDSKYIEDRKIPKSKHRRSDSSPEDSSDEGRHRRRRRISRTSSTSSKDEIINVKNLKKQHKSSHLAADDRRKMKNYKSRRSRSLSSSDGDHHRRRKNEQEISKKSSKSGRDHKTDRRGNGSSFSLEKQESKKSSRKYSSGSSSSSEEESKGYKKSKKRHKKKHHRSRS